MPRPHSAYSSRSWSTITSTFQAPPSFLTHSVVAAGVQCDIATKWMEVCLFARVRSVRKSFSETVAAISKCLTSTVASEYSLWDDDYSQGHPQNLRNSSIVGRPSAVGNCNLGWLCARSPMFGGLRTGFCGGGGVVQDCRAFGTPHCTFANGLAKPVSPPSAPFVFPFFVLPFPNKPSVFGSDTPPSPAFRRAIFVPRELNMFADVVQRS